MEEVKLKGSPIKLDGKFVHIGEMAPDFEMVKKDLSTYSLKDSKGKYVVLNIFPSLDTSVCAQSVRKFNEIAVSMPNSVVLAISKDLPFAQERFCSTEGIDNLIALSDFRNISDFGKRYGVLIEDSPLKGLFARAVIILDTEGRIIYTELAPEITHEPNYEKAIKALKEMENLG